MDLKALSVKQYTAKLAKAATALLFVFILFGPLGSSFAFAPSVLADNKNNSEKDIILRSEAETYYIFAVNKLRTENNLAPLVIDSRLSKSAKEKGDDMVANSYWGHYAPNQGLSFSDFIWQNLPYAETVGENLAKCFKTKKEAFNALKASPTHLANMLGRYDNLGIAEVYNPNDGCTHTIMHFAYYN